MSKPDIADAIAEALEARSELTQITSNEVIEIVMDTIARCRKPGKLQAANVMKGCELLGKHLGMFTDKHDVKLSGKVGGAWQVNIVKSPTSE